MMESKKKIYITSAIFLGIGLFLIVLLVWPLLGGIKDLSEELILEKSQAAHLVQEKEDIERLEAILQEQGEDLKKLEGLFLDPENPVDFIGFLEKEARRSELGFEIASLGPGQEGPWPSLHFQIKNRGSFPGFLRFLEGLETAPYLIEVLNLQARRVNEEDLGRSGFEGLSLGDVKASALIRVFTR